MTVAPDWLCEVLSTSTRRINLHEKRPISAREGVAHLWLVNPTDRTLEAFELHDGQWLLIASARDDEAVSNRTFDDSVCLGVGVRAQPSSDAISFDRH